LLSLAAVWAAVAKAWQFVCWRRERLALCSCSCMLSLRLRAVLPGFSRLLLCVLSLSNYCQGCWAAGLALKAAAALGGGEVDIAAAQQQDADGWESVTAGHWLQHEPDCIALSKLKLPPELGKPLCEFHGRCKQVKQRGRAGQGRWVPYMRQAWPGRSRCQQVPDLGDLYPLSRTM
jgi:hypothetical protein